MSSKQSTASSILFIVTEPKTSLVRSLPLTVQPSAQIVRAAAELFGSVALSSLTGRPMGASDPEDVHSTEEIDYMEHVRLFVLNTEPSPPSLVGLISELERELSRVPTTGLRTVEGNWRGDPVKTAIRYALSKCSNWKTDIYVLDKNDIQFEGDMTEHCQETEPGYTWYSMQMHPSDYQEFLDQFGERVHKQRPTHIDSQLDIA